MQGKAARQGRKLDAGKGEVLYAACAGRIAVEQLLGLAFHNGAYDKGGRHGDHNENARHKRRHEKGFLVFHGLKILKHGGVENRKNRLDPW